MSRRKFREEWIAGAFVQIPGGPVSSLTGLTVASLATLANLTANSLTGAAGWRGIATINSGTNVASVAATAAVSGAVILATPIQGANMVSSGQEFVIGVSSVRAGAFELVICGSFAGPSANLPVAWAVIR